MSHEHRVFTTPLRPGKQPGWARQTVYTDSGTVGYVDRHEEAGQVRWLPCTARWDSVGDRTTGFPDQQAAITALVAATQGGATSS